ncbi:MAG: CoA transferase [Gammaproteobacteria bacterium]|nr:CoA transferase [Gammaproteobacteria bacterium]
MLPLEGVRVVALEQAVAAPFTTRQLADLGATVIKIERPGSGDFARHYDKTVQGLSSHFVWLNRSKKSVTLNVKHQQADAIIGRLLARADVFVQNLAPGAAARLGLSGAALVARFPRLIVCNISGYGDRGPYRDKKAYDLLVQSEAGLVSITGSPEAPAKVGISVADIAAGMYAYSGVLTALYQRRDSGFGTVLDVSMFDALGEWMGYPAYYTAYGGSAPQRTGTRHATIAPYGQFTSRDGQAVLLGIQNEREWAQFCDEVLRRPELTHDSRFVSNDDRAAHYAELETEINKVFSELTADEIVARLDNAQIANAHVNNMQEFWEHPQLDARDRRLNIETPVGPITALLPPVIMAGAEVRMGPVPALGEHTDEVLRDLGYTAGQIADLGSAGAI